MSDDHKTPPITPEQLAAFVEWLGTASLRSTRDFSERVIPLLDNLDMVSWKPGFIDLVCHYRQMLKFARVSKQVAPVLAGLWPLYEGDRDT